MSRERAVELLRSGLVGVKEWNDWLKSNSVEALDGVSFDGLELDGVNLTACSLRGTQFNRCGMAGALFYRAQLTGAGFADAVLRGASFEEANLLAAELDGADLTQANLRDARLSDASLRNATLSGANFEGTNLSRTNLTGANLKGADLSYAKMSATKLHRADLSEAVLGHTLLARLEFRFDRTMLASITHRGPSSLGLDTMIRSRGQLPVEFLQGCGLAEWEIELAALYNPDISASEAAEVTTRAHHLRIGAPIQIHPLFISYSRANSDFVDRMGTELNRNSIRYWRDIKDATAGRLDKVIERGIALNPIVLMVLSRDSVTSSWVQFEIDAALALSKKLNRDVLCPLMLDKAWLDAPLLSGHFRTQLKQYNVVDFSDWREPGHFTTSFANLIEGLKVHYQSV
ncbi:MAG TPA: toll/interleukin-1 receptor domain-containing protein [Polyangiaceae bacterium]|nr:toll/interleukin-1 receptor domain-containing protein [Polyangiaceae bacterium]